MLLSLLFVVIIVTSGGSRATEVTDLFCSYEVLPLVELNGKPVVGGLLLL